MQATGSHTLSLRLLVESLGDVPGIIPSEDLLIIPIQNNPSTLLVTKQGSLSEFYTLVFSPAMQDAAARIASITPPDAQAPPAPTRSHRAQKPGVRIVTLVPGRQLLGKRPSKVCQDHAVAPMDVEALAGTNTQDSSLSVPLKRMRLSSGLAPEIQQAFLASPIARAQSPVPCAQAASVSETTGGDVCMRSNHSGTASVQA